MKPGVSVAVREQAIQSLEIRVEGDEYLIEGNRNPFRRTASNEALQGFAKELMPAFRKLERAVVTTGTINLSKDEGLGDVVTEATGELITWGRRAFNLFFKDDKPRSLMRRMVEFHENRGYLVAPYFWMSEIPFPWELLYPLDEETVPSGADPLSFFWGMQYPLSRNLTDLTFELHIPEQDPRANMLFGLHQKLRHAHRSEWPKLRELITASGDGEIYVLGGEIGMGDLANVQYQGKDVLKYLYTAEHNMVHFACHCVPEDDHDVLLLSLIDSTSELENEEIVGEAPPIRLGTLAFLDASGVFQRRNPLVFLNACQTAGDQNPVALGLNLPEEFVNKGAAAMIATACPVPDLFAASFARKFYELFLQEGVEIGIALRDTRRHFWQEYRNPLGLAYGLYSSPYYRVRPQQSQGGLV